MEIPNGWKITQIKYKREHYILVTFSYNTKDNEIIKLIPEVRWSYTLKGWLVPNSEENRMVLGIENPVKLNEDTIEKITLFKLWLKSKRYSENTIKTYLDALVSFLKYFANKSIEEITNDDIIAYNNDYFFISVG